MIEVKVTDKTLELDLVQKALSHKSGAVDVFIGAVRSTTNGKTVLRLEYEAYQKMAEKELKIIARTINKRWTVNDIVIHHRIGVLGVGEIAVIIVIGAERRDDCMSACRYAIDTLKVTVPIWKKEVYTDDSQWVQPHP